MYQYGEVIRNTENSTQHIMEHSFQICNALYHKN